MIPNLWLNRNFRLMCASATATNLGDGVMAVALPWLATGLTDDPLLIGLVAGARSLPWLLFALPAGVITDRFDHRRLLIGADLTRIALTLALLVLALTAHPGTAPVLAMAALCFALGAAEVLRDNTAQTFLPSVVAKAQLEQANAALWTGEQLAGQFIGPPLAGLLIGVSVALPFGLHAGLLAVGTVLVIAMVVPRRMPAPNPAPALAALREGVVWLWRNVMLRRLAVLLGGFNFVGYGYEAVLVLYSQRVLGLDAFGYGALLTLTAAGGLAGSLIGPAILRRITPRAGILAGMTGFTVASTVLALHAPLWLIGLTMAGNGFTGMLWGIAQVSYRQRHIPAPLLGRVNSAFRFVGTGPAAFGAITFGALIAFAAPVGPTAAVLLPYWVAAGIGAALTLYAAFRLRLEG